MSPKPAPNPDQPGAQTAIDTTATTATEAPLPAVPDAQAPALVNTDDDPWAGVDAGDLSPDEGGLIPALSMNRKLDGGFLAEDTGEISDNVTFVWLAKMRSRAWWPQAFGKGDAAPTCRSLDGVKPDPASPEVQNPACATCPHAAWEQEGEDRRCAESIEALVFMPDDLGAGRLARLRFNGIAIAPARAYWSSFDRRLPRRPPLSVVTECHLEPTETKNGKFLSPKFRVVDELTRAQVNPLIVERDQRIADWKAFVARDVATRAADADETTEDGTAAQTVVDGDGEPF